jgi:hypothetical protein
MILVNEVTSLKAWIGSPDWQASYDLASRRRLPETGQWLLSDPTYRNFVDMLIDHNQESPAQILQILGKQHAQEPNPKPEGHAKLRRQTRIWQNHLINNDYRRSTKCSRLEVGWAPSYFGFLSF